MKVFMIDNNLNKQNWFLLILEKLNGLARERGLNIAFEAGLGSNVEEAGEKARDAVEIFAALRESNAIYLLDITLEEDEEQGPALLAKLQQSGDPAMVAGAEKYQAIRAAGNGLAGIAKKYPLMLLALLCCRTRPTMLVSTDTVNSIVTKVKQSGLAKVAYDGFPDDDPKRTDPESRTKIVREWAEYILALLDPLDLLKNRTGNWFSKEIGSGWRSAALDGLPHNPNWAQFDRTQHMATVKDVLHWAPDSWWENDEKASVLHECLKHIIGRHAEWMAEGGDRELCLGGAYLVFLLALAQRFPGELPRFLAADWKPFALVQGGTAKPTFFLPSQWQADAERSIRALYAFFSAVIPLKSDQQKLGVTEISLPATDKPFFRLKLDWAATELSACGSAIGRMVDTGVATETLPLPQAKTTGAFLRFSLTSCVRKRGLGPVGTVSIGRDGWLRVGR